MSLRLSLGMPFSLLATLMASVRSCWEDDVAWMMPACLASGAVYFLPRIIDSWKVVEGRRRLQTQKNKLKLSQRGSYETRITFSPWQEPWAIHFEWMECELNDLKPVVEKDSRIALCATVLNKTCYATLIYIFLWNIPYLIKLWGTLYNGLRVGERDLIEWVMKRLRRGTVYRLSELPLGHFECLL